MEEIFILTNTRFLKNLETWKNLEFSTTLTCSVVKFQFDTKNIS